MCLLYIIKITDSFKANIAQTSHISISIYELTVKRTIHPNKCTRPIKLTNLFIIVNNHNFNHCIENTNML